MHTDPLANAVRHTAPLGGQPVRRGFSLGCELVRTRDRSLRLMAPPPGRPTLILDEAARERAFASLADLAAAVHALRRGRAIRLQARARARADGSTTFPTIDVYVCGLFGDETWLCAAAIQTRDPETLSRALEAVQPQAGAQ